MQPGHGLGPPRLAEPEGHSERAEERVQGSTWLTYLSSHLGVTQEAEGEEKGQVRAGSPRPSRWVSLWETGGLEAQRYANLHLWVLYPHLHPTPPVFFLFCLIPGELGTI